MPRITIINLHNREIFSNAENDTALKIIHENNIDWMHACGGKGRCTSCKMIVEEGMSNLAEVTEPEKKYKAQGRLKDNERLACQTKVLSDIRIKVAEINKFPHINYSE